MPPIDEPASFEATGGRKARSPSAADQPEKIDLVSVTLEAATGRLVSAEAVDSGGARRELPEEVRVSLAAPGDALTVETIVERAFEAGIDCVLGGGDGSTDGEQSDDDADLSRALLRSLIDRSAVRRLVQQEVLSRAIVATLMASAANPQTSPTASH